MFKPHWRIFKNKIPCEFLKNLVSFFSAVYFMGVWRVYKRAKSQNCKNTKNDVKLEQHFLMEKNVRQVFCSFLTWIDLLLKDLYFFQNLKNLKWKIFFRTKTYKKCPYLSEVFIPPNISVQLLRCFWESL